MTNANPLKTKTQETDDVFKLKFEVHWQGRESWTAVGLLSAFVIGLVIAISLLI